METNALIRGAFYGNLIFDLKLCPKLCFNNSFIKCSIGVA